jgi:hypothetical protein
MFILYALPLGVVLGLLTRGRLTAITEVRLRWAPLALLGLIIQVVLFFGPVAEAVGWLGMPIYVGSTALVLVVVIRNAARPGLAVVALGALSNLAAIIANGGYMPASPAAMAALGKTVGEGYSNSAVMNQPMLWPLTDIFAIPAGVPFANVFSVGDVLIGLGVAWALAAAMHARPTGTADRERTGGAGEKLERARARIERLMPGSPALASATASPASGIPAAAALPDRSVMAATAAGRMTAPPRPLAASLPQAEPSGPPAGGSWMVDRLRRMPVSDAWGSDLALATWLAENVDLVGDATGVAISSGQVLESERPVVLAEHAGQSVVIVAERGPATDDAFGCLVRHVAACQAELGIWICSELVDEHAATVAWLNVATGITFAMLGLAAVRIGDSAPAALLELAVRAPRADDPRYQPNDNARAAGAGRRAGDWLRPT